MGCDARKSCYVNLKFLKAKSNFEHREKPGHVTVKFDDNGRIYECLADYIRLYDSTWNFGCYVCANLHFFFSFLFVFFFGYLRQGFSV